MVAGSLAALVAAVVIVGLLVTRSDQNGAVNGTSSPTPTGDVEVQVEQSYLDYWEARTAALLELDPAPFEQVTTAAALEASRKLVEDQRRSGQPVRVRVEHNYRVVIRSQNEAVIDDTLISHSVRLDPRTKEPVEPDPNLTIRNSYTLRKVDGQWKVAEIIGIEPSP
jgi:hypothetical protein